MDNYKNPSQEPQRLCGVSVEGLRHLLFNLQDQDQSVNIVTNEKHGQVISTKAVTGIRLHTDENGKNHITFTTN